MNTRLRKLIDLKTSGNQAEFAALMGWKPQYLFRLLNGQSGFGIRPVMALLQRFPELNARWLLLGQGAMLTSGVDAVKEHLLRLLTLEKYMPVMTADQIRQMTEEGRTDFTPDDIAQWEHLLQQRNQHITDAINRSSLK